MNFRILGDEESARRIDLVDNQILLNGMPVITEETSHTRSHEMNFLVQKQSIVSSDGESADSHGIGIGMTDIEIRQRKAEIEQEQIQQKLHRLEIGYYQKLTELQDQFQKKACQVAHDINSPLSTMLMMLKMCRDIPEPHRVTMRNVANRISDIANNLTASFGHDGRHGDTDGEQRESILVSSILLEILAEKRYQFQDLELKLEHRFSSAATFSWIRINSNALRRMVSNLVDNAVEALENRPGQVNVDLELIGNQIRIIIQDNGKGMSPQLVNKIMNKMSIGAGKSGGSGFGMSQVHESLEENEGQIDIVSQVGEGTRIALTFPCVPAQNWIVDFIQLDEDDTVVVLDDGGSIFAAWNFRFECFRKVYPNLKLVHHSRSQDAINYFGQLNAEQRQKVFLLSNYELLQQSLNGLQVIAKVDALRSALVTSYHEHRAIQLEATKVGTRILPRLLASEVPIWIGKQGTAGLFGKDSVRKLKKIDAVFVDDDRDLLKIYKLFARDKFSVDIYDDPKKFLVKISDYPKHTKIFLDQHYSNYDKNGMDIAAKLRELGFVNLYLLTGDRSLVCRTPDYLTLIIKCDLEVLSAIMRN